MFFFVWAIAKHPVGPDAAPRTQAADAHSPDSIQIGDTVKVAYAQQANGNEGYWPCGSTKEALDEMTKWAVRGDEAELKRVMRNTGSIGLTSGLRVKVLDAGGFLMSERKVRVIANADGQVYLKDEQGSFLADPRIGRECWVLKEGLAR